VLAQLIVMGLAAGCLYSLIALAMVIIHKTSEILNFAQGEMAMISTYFAFFLLTRLELPFWAAFPAALGFSLLLGALCELLFLGPAREHGRVIPLILLWSFTALMVYLAIFSAPGVPVTLAVVVLAFAIWITAELLGKKKLWRAPTLLGLIIITLGMEMILYGAAGGIWGASQESLPTPVSDLSVHELGSVVISDLNLVIFGTSVVLMLGLFLFFRYTRVGIAMKATAQNPLAARLMGIRPRRIYLLTWALSSLVGAIAGLLTASAQPLDPNLMMEPLLKGFAAAVLGGMNSLPGAAVGGYLLGILENLAAGYLPDGTQFKSTIAFLVIVLVLCVRPSGLLGRHYIKKV
jgi:branched-chain amino acid transport system permease protein